MYYIIYKITNKINGKYYIGSHKTKNLNDNYMGSGKYLRHAQIKHGICNFEKEILFSYDNPEEMYAKEAEIVNEDFISEENTYNIKLGGFGGFDYLNANKLNNSSKSKYTLSKGCIVHAKRLLEDEEYLRTHKSLCSSRFKSLHREGKLKYDGFKGKTHTDDSKARIGLANSKNTGSKSSQFGTMWITDGKENKKISKFSPIPDNWAKGRTMVK